MDLSSLVYHRSAFLEGQWWLPFSAQLAHLSPAHAAANIASGALLWILFRSWLRWQQQCLALAGGALFVALVVVLDVHCNYYAGASGALHGWAAGGAVLLLTFGRENKGIPLLIGTLLLLGLIAKLLWQSPHATALSTWGFAVYTPSHWAGASGGAAFALLAIAARLTREKRRGNS